MAKWQAKWLGLCGIFVLLSACKVGNTDGSAPVTDKAPGEPVWGKMAASSELQAGNSDVVLDWTIASGNAASYWELLQNDAVIYHENLSGGTPQNVQYVASLSEAGEVRFVARVCQDVDGSSHCRESIPFTHAVTAPLVIAPATVAPMDSSSVLQNGAAKFNVKWTLNADSAATQWQVIVNGTIVHSATLSSGQRAGEYAHDVSMAGDYTVVVRLCRDSNCTDSAPQNFRVGGTTVSNSVQFISEKTPTLCIAAIGQIKADAVVDVATCNSTASAQRWLASNDSIKPASAENLCITATKLSNYGTFSLKTCDASDVQKWTLNNGSFEHLIGSSKIAFDVADAKQLIAYDFHGGTNQRWKTMQDTSGGGAMPGQAQLTVAPSTTLVNGKATIAVNWSQSGVAAKSAQLMVNNTMTETATVNSTTSPQTGSFNYQVSAAGNCAFVVRLCNDNGCSNSSSATVEVKGAAEESPGKPLISGIKADYQLINKSVDIALQWNKSSGGDGSIAEYWVNGVRTRIETLSSTGAQRGSYTYVASSAGAHEFIVKLCKKTLCTASDTVTTNVKADSKAPAAPSSLISAVNINNIDLNWMDNASDETAVVLERRLNKEATFKELISLTADTRDFKDETAAYGETYVYRVKAHNSNGESAYSNSATVLLKNTGENLFSGICAKCHNPQGTGGDLFDGRRLESWKAKKFDEFLTRVATMELKNCNAACQRDAAEYVWATRWKLSTGNDVVLTAGGRGHRLSRLLSPIELRNTVRDRLGYTIADADLPKEHYDSKFKYPTQNDTGVLLQETVQKYFALFETVAQNADLAKLGCSTSACTSAQVATVGLRLWRRPLSSSETTTLTAFNTAHGARELVLAMMLTPDFLYHVELGTWNATAAAYELTPYEWASVLSYALWGSTPDDALYSAAAANQLSTRDQLSAHIDRLMADVKFTTQFNAFLRYYTKSAQTVISEKPGLSASLISAMLSERSEAVKYLLTQGSANFDELLNPGYTFVNANLAAHYGISGVSSSTMVKVTTDRNRGGLLHQGLTQITNSDFAATSLVKRGKMIRENLMCHTMGVPSGVDPATITMPTTAITTRERWDIITGPTASNGQCWSCHKLMNEPGSVLEAFDQTGKFRTQEESYTVKGVMLALNTKGILRDNTGTLELNNYNDARDLTTYLAKNDSVRECFVDSFYRHLTGIRVDEQARSGVSQVQQTFVQNGEIKTMIKDMLLGDFTRYRVE